MALSRRRKFVLAGACLLALALLAFLLLCVEKSSPGFTAELFFIDSATGKTLDNCVLLTETRLVSGPTYYPAHAHTTHTGYELISAELRKIDSGATIRARTQFGLRIPFLLGHFDRYKLTRYAVCRDGFSYRNIDDLMLLSGGKVTLNLDREGQDSVDRVLAESVLELWPKLQGDRALKLELLRMLVKKVEREISEHPPALRREKALLADLKSTLRAFEESDENEK